MSQEAIAILTEATKVVAKESYDDFAKPILKETGGTFGTVFGLINHVLLYKPKSWIIKYKAKLEKYAVEQKRQLDDIPEQHKVEPKLNILVPTIEGVAMNLDDEDITSMFTSLLTSACDKTKENLVHPGFVEAIKQMSSIDAKVFEKLCTYSNFVFGERIPTITPRAELINDRSKILLGLLPNWVTEIEIQGCTLFDISCSITQLVKLGLINNSSRYFSEKSRKLAEQDELKILMKKCKQLSLDPVDLQYDESSFEITEYGLRFISSCVVSQSETARKVIQQKIFFGNSN